MNAEELIERFKKSFNAPSTKDERLKVVLICIVISTTFWFFNALNQDNYTSQISYPLAWEYDETLYMPVGELPERVGIEVTGGGWDLMTRSFGFNMGPVNISLNDPSAAKYLLSSQLRAELSRNLDPVTINFLIEDSLKFDIQPIISRKIALSFDDSALRFDSDYRLNSSYQLNPDSIEVSGPESLVTLMPEVLSVLGEFDDIDEDVSESLAIPELPALIETTLSSISLSFEVMHYINISERHNVELINFPDSTWQTSTPAIVIDYQIGESQFDATDSSRVKLVADFKQWNEQDSTVQIEVIQGRELIEDIRLSTERIKVYKP